MNIFAAAYIVLAGLAIIWLIDELVTEKRENQQLREIAHQALEEANIAKHDSRFFEPDPQYDYDLEKLKV